MSDNVNEIMERMVPDLRDMEENGIFSHGEITSIIHKRRGMEYAMSSYSKTIQDYLTAIQYEINLETLRKMRKNRLGLSKYLKSDSSVVNRTHFIFERMIRRYKSDLNVWLKYVEFCESIGANGKLGTLFPRILQLHPRAEGVWVKAANWEMSQGNFSNARSDFSAFRSLIALMQRAIRINKHSQLLWKEYFRFELGLSLAVLIAVSS
ncbi:uncharacterized protein [Blastocystis hominis]|uniref:U3 small nucleolar RNA-associated protein 6 n=1 Tax=Blastocystis hominis TaxID=12968 RepID=D8M4H4_BLAHO|nr:uncharacterized protein [Blastocystis hominis]CBK22963.2 unnamed protein product [Blastocystis hominis]|eukprot:XP_012897011.1 uncharacterized protein [Blastocystis hominis]